MSDASESAFWTAVAIITVSFSALLIWIFYGPEELEEDEEYAEYLKNFEKPPLEQKNM